MSRGDPVPPPTVTAEGSIERLGGKYYAHCQAVFREATDQSQKMLAYLDRLTAGRDQASILSVGSGTGLFEIPMLERMASSGIELTGFVGLDVDRHACQELSRRLRSQFGKRLRYRVRQQAFEQYRTDQRFDLVLFVHTFEYLAGEPVRWMRRALELLAAGGQCVIFSPQRGGINAIYEQVTDGVFSDDLKRLLEQSQIEHRVERIRAECDIGPLLEAAHPDQIALLSFLTQLDCRPLGHAQQREFIDYYRSLANASTPHVPHPTTAFVITP